MREDSFYVRRVQDIRLEHLAHLGKDTSMARAQGQGLLITIDTDSDEPIYEQVYDQVRHAVETGKLKEGDRLPSIRKLCSDLCISHTTAERAYLQLSVEGYVRNVPRSGYVVEKIDTDYLRSLAASSADM